MQYVCWKSIRPLSWACWDLIQHGVILQGWDGAETGCNACAVDLTCSWAGRAAGLSERRTIVGHEQIIQREHWKWLKRKGWNFELDAIAKSSIQNQNQRIMAWNVQEERHHIDVIGPLRYMYISTYTIWQERLTDCKWVLDTSQRIGHTPIGGRQL